ncbi:hypothetical protein BGZ93_002405, partial [Podila epicladia]
MSLILHKRAPAPQIPPSPPPPKPKPKPKPKPTDKPPKPKPTTAPSPVVPPPTTTGTTVSTTTTTLSSTTSTLPLDTQTSKSGSDGKSNTGLIAGAVAGTLAVILIAAGIVFLRKRKRTNQELKEAELYQQQRVMRQNDDNNRSSAVYGFGGHHRGGEDVERGNNEYLLKHTVKVQRQPSWWSRKKPLEYYQQVPPRDHLQRTRQQRQEQDIGQLRSDETMINRSAYSSGQGVDRRAHDSILEESLEPLQPGQQGQSQRTSRENTKGLLRLNENASTKPARARHEYSPSRPISSIEPVSPIGSVFEGSTTSTSLPHSPQRDVVHSLPSTSNNRSRARSSIPYPPPPPVLTSLTASVTPAPPSRQDGKGPPYRPPTGFYDFGGSDEETKRPSGQFASGYQPHQDPQQIQHQPLEQPPYSGGVLPPPIPRATRPQSISIVKPKPRSNTNPGHGVPAPLSPTSPISPTGSEPELGPKIGGRRAR